MSGIIRQVRLIYVETVDSNNNKFWNGTLYDNNDVFVEWGRVGYTGQSKTHPGVGERKLESLEKEKKKKGYTEQRIVASTATTGTGVITKRLDLAEVAARQIKTDTPEVIGLVKYLAKANIHNITSGSGITYDEVDGVFKTPLGVVTDDGLVEARELLEKISDFVAANDFDNKKFLGLCGQYMRIIPTNIGMRKFDARTDMGSLDHVRRQNDVLDSLKTALEQIADAYTQQDAARQKDKPKIFQCSLELVNDTETIKTIDALYNKTLHRSHACAHLRLLKVFAVKIDTMVAAFEEGKKVGNVMELWHGTKAANLLSIMKGGFMIPRSNAPHCTGAMFGLGTYFSDQSTKSLNYAYGYWGGGRDNNCFMFLNQVAMGKPYTPVSYTERLPKAGFDSTFAMAGRSGVQNNEMVIYKTSQCNPIFLCQFSQ